MKTKSLFTLGIIALISYNSQAQIVKQYPDTIGLRNDLKSGAADIYELTTSGGVYVVAGYITPAKSFTLRAASGLAVKPVLKYNNSNPGGNSAFFSVASNGVTITLNGMEVNGVNINTTGVQPGLLNAQNAAATNCKLVINDCYIHDMLNTSLGFA